MPTMRSTHSQQLERWLGHANVDHLSRSMRNWYGPPIAVHGVPGCVYATGDGDFIGESAAPGGRALTDAIQGAFGCNGRPTSGGPIPMS